jgi:acyl-CoA thioesterase I
MSFKPLDSCKVFICGDSISAGVVYDEGEQKYVKSRETFVCMMQNRLNCAVTNISRFGNTISTALPRLKRNMTKEKPDVVVIELGGNDCNYKWDQIAADPKAEHLPATDIGIFRNTLEQLAVSLKLQGIQPVFTTLPPLDPDRYFSWVSKSSSQAAKCILEWLGSVSRIYWWQERYNAAVIKAAQNTNAALIDLRGAFLSTVDFRNYICKDGIHPNKDGHMLICKTISDYLNIKCPALLKPVIA